MASRFRTVQATLSAELAKPYVYGQSDCFLMGCRMADALDAALGMVDRYRRSYTTLAGAQRALRKRGHKSLVSFFAEHLEPCPPAAARLGDLVILRLADGAEHVGVCLGTRFVTKTERGREDYALGDCIAAFRTGER